MRLKLQLRSPIQGIFIAGAALLCAFSPLAMVQAEAQTTYYVATNGSDSNNGSINSPWATPQHSSTVAKPGDTVIVEDGTYNLGSSGGTGDWRIANGGTASLPVTYMAQHKWQAKLVGHGSGDGTTAIGLAGGYTIIKDFDITGSDANGINLTTNGTAASYNQVLDNYIHDMVTPCDANSGAGVTSGSGGNNYAGVGHETVNGNLIVNLVAAGGCPGGHQASGIAMMLPYGVAANNIVINCGDAIEAWHAATNTIFYGNVVINSGRGISLGAGDAPGGVIDNNSLVENNIIVNGSGPAIIETGGTGLSNVYRDNLVFGGNTAIQLSNGLSATGTIDADPKFVNNTGRPRVTIACRHLLPLVAPDSHSPGLRPTSLGMFVRSREQQILEPASLTLITLLLLPPVAPELSQRVSVRALLRSPPEELRHLHGLLTTQ